MDKVNKKLKNEILTNRFERLVTLVMILGVIREWEKEKTGEDWGKGFKSKAKNLTWIFLFI